MRTARCLLSLILLALPAVAGADAPGREGKPLFPDLQRFVVERVLPAVAELGEDRRAVLEELAHYIRERDQGGRRPIQGPAPGRRPGRRAGRREGRRSRRSGGGARGTGRDLPGGRPPGSPPRGEGAGTALGGPGRAGCAPRRTPGWRRARGGTRRAAATPGSDPTPRARKAAGRAGRGSPGENRRAQPRAEPKGAPQHGSHGYVGGVVDAEKDAGGPDP